MKMFKNKLYHIRLEFDVATNYRTPNQIKEDIERNFSKSGLITYTTTLYEYTEISQ